MIATIGDVLFVSACCRNGLTPRFDAREAWIAVVFFFFFFVVPCTQFCIGMDGIMHRLRGM